jgi:hypothetical protein
LSANEISNTSADVTAL